MRKLIIETNLRSFSTTCVLQALKNHRLYPKIIWERVESGQYAVVDPVNPGSIMYLSEQDYIILVRTSMVANKTPKVLATPEDTPPSPTDESPSPSQNSPTSVESMAHPYLEGITFTSKRGSEDARRARGRLRSLFKSRLDQFRKKLPYWDQLGIKRMEKTSMVNLWVRNISQWFNLWHDSVSWWSRGSLMSTVAAAERATFGLRLKENLRSRGIQYIILRLKVGLFVVLSFLGNNRMKNSQALGLRIRIRSGLPSFLPLYVRTGLRQGNKHTIHIWTTMLNSYKGIAGKHMEPNLEHSSITQDHPCYAQSETFSLYQQWFSELFWKWLGIRQLPIDALKIKELFFTTHAGPSHPNSVLGSGLDASLWAKSPRNLIREWMTLTGQSDILLEFRKAGKMSDLTESALRAMNAKKSPTWTPLTSLLGADKLESSPPCKRTLSRLCTLYEAAGKVRVIAIVDYWTNAVLKPLHDWMFKVLKSLPQDATFDQEGKVREFSTRGYQNLWSLDLKSATDLIPLHLYRALFCWVLPSRVLDLWIELLVDRDFTIPPQVEKAYPDHEPTVRYRCGQPMGALTSWASMALVHHALVLYAAVRAGVLRPLDGPLAFTDYLVLGDDVVIANEAVALSYQALASDLGIPISIHKSYISRNGLFNFANQTYLQSDNLSPLSLKEEVGVNSIVERVELALRAVRRGWCDMGSSGWLAPLSKLFIQPKVWYHDVVPLLSKYGVVHPVVRWILSVLFLPGTARFADLGLGRASISAYLGAMLRKGVLYSNPIESISNLVSKQRSEPLLLSLLSKWVTRVYNEFLENRKRLKAFQPWVELTLSPEVEYLLNRIFSEAKQKRMDAWVEKYRMPLKEVQVASSLTKGKISHLEIGTDREFESLVDLICEAEADLPRVPLFTEGDLGALGTILGKPDTGSRNQEQSVALFLRITNIMGFTDHLCSPATPGISLAGRSPSNLPTLGREIKKE